MSYLCEKCKKGILIDISGDILDNDNGIWWCSYCGALYTVILGKLDISIPVFFKEQNHA